MNFDFSEDQKLLQKTARDFLAEHSPLAVNRRVLESDDVGAGHFEGDLHRVAVDRDIEPADAVLMGCVPAFRREGRGRPAGDDRRHGCEQEGGEANVTEGKAIGDHGGPRKGDRSKNVITLQIRLKSLFCDGSRRYPR